MVDWLKNIRLNKVEGGNVVDVNSVHDVVFKDLTHDAMGVAKINGFPIFVKDALKGETGRIKIYKVNKNFGLGTLLNVKEVSPFRKEPICDVHHQCGGCNLMHMHYDMQLSFKRHRVKETLKRLGKIDTTVLKTVGMNNPYYYRNKAMIPFSYRNGEVIAGFFKPKSHEVVDIKKCYIYPKAFSEILKHVKLLVEQLDIPIFDAYKKQGIFRGLMLRKSHKYDELMVVLIATNGKIPQRDKLIKVLIERFPMIKSVILNIAPPNTKFMLGSKSKVLYGEDMIKDELLGIRYTISHQSFYQINPEQTELLYQKALDYAELSEEDTVLDAYSGIGTIGLSTANQVKEVIGFDSVKSAVKNAQKNVKDNKITNAQYYHFKASEALQKIKDFNVDKVFLDPPRKGVDEMFLNALVTLKPKRIIYVSCNVATLARDSQYLVSRGYDLKEVTPYDLFPQTAHIESVALFKLK